MLLEAMGEEKRGGHFRGEATSPELQGKRVSEALTF